MGNNRYQPDNRDRELVVRLYGLAACYTWIRGADNLLGGAPISILQELPGDDHALDLVGALVDLGDRGPPGSFRR
jgi:hypothetical protein